MFGLESAGAHSNWCHIVEMAFSPQPSPHRVAQIVAVVLCVCCIPCSGLMHTGIRIWGVAVQLIMSLKEHEPAIVFIFARFNIYQFQQVTFTRGWNGSLQTLVVQWQLNFCRWAGMRCLSEVCVCVSASAHLTKKHASERRTGNISLASVHE